MVTVFVVGLLVIIVSVAQLVVVLVVAGESKY